MQKSFNYTLGISFVLPFLIMACKTVQMGGDLSPLLPEQQYQVAYEFRYKDSPEGVFVKAFIPQNNEHQHIQVVETRSTIPSQIKRGPTGHIARWESKAQGRDTLLSTESAPLSQILYTFKYTGREISYTLGNRLTLVDRHPDSLRPHLLPSEHIQSEDPQIQKKALEVSGGTKNLRTVLQRLYTYTYNIPRIKSSELMDAKTCLMEWEASCNGRSRLFVAMARSLNIPARLVGGMILEKGSKRTSHQWVEAYVQGNWIPFDALNGHYARLPAHYLELYRGDEFLISHTPDISFDWTFHIEEKVISSQRAQIEGAGGLSSIQDPLLFHLSEAGMSIAFMKILLLLPVLGLVVILCKNVVGLKTIGTFLPAILGISFSYSGLLYGLFSLALVMLWVWLMYRPLESWGLLQSPKLVVLLTGVVFIIFLISLWDIQGKEVLGSTTTFFPLVILTFLSERFARKIDEEGIEEAGKLLGQSLLVACACYLVFSSSFLESLMMMFPELLLVVMGATLLVGKWIGLRVVEYIRFQQLVFDKN